MRDALCVSVLRPRFFNDKGYIIQHCMAIQNLNGYFLPENVNTIQEVHGISMLLLQVKYLGNALVKSNDLYIGKADAGDTFIVYFCQIISIIMLKRNKKDCLFSHFCSNKKLLY